MSKAVQTTKICRACLLEHSVMQSIFQCSLKEMLMECTSVKIEVDDGLPELICIACLQQLNKSYLFKKQCEKSDYNLRQTLLKSEETYSKNEYNDDYECDNYEETDDPNYYEAEPDNTEDDKVDTDMDIICNDFKQINEKQNTDSNDEIEDHDSKDTKHPDIINKNENISAEIARLKLIPAKSKDLYEKEYEKFCEWRCAKNVSSCDENLIMTYLSQMSKVYKPSSLWCTYSKLKKMLKVKESVDISKFLLVTEYMKSNYVSSESKKAWVLQRNQIQEFMLKAPDHTYLLIKVVAAFGMFGACRREELHDIRVQDVTTEGSVLLVKIRQTKTYMPRQFAIVPDDGPVDYSALYNKYSALRPKHVKIHNLFLSYHNGKCSSQPVGKNTFGKMPQMIADFLKLPDANKYTGHCFRRSAATMLAECGGDIRTLKQSRGWRSDKIAESYVENSLKNKI